MKEDKPWYKVWWFYALVIVVVALVINMFTDTEEEEAPAGRVTTTVTRSDKSTPTVRTATTRKEHFTAEEMADKCWSSWDGNWEEFEDLIRSVLNDPDSMSTQGTYFNPSDDTSDGTIRVRLNYTATNGFGGTVRNDAVAYMGVDCQVKEVLTFGE